MASFNRRRAGMGTVLISELSVDCIIGILARERVQPQRLLLSVDVDVDFTAAAASDDVSATVNYAEVAELLRDLAIDNQYQLVERLVSDGCDLLLDRFPQVARVAVTARKPDILPDTDFVGARLEKWRD